LAIRALFRGGTWPGGAHVPPMVGPLLPPGDPEIWVGGRSRAVLGVAARVADAWNGWGYDSDAFASRAAELRELAGDRLVAPTWAGIALVGEDPVDLERLRADRTATVRRVVGDLTDEQLASLLTYIRRSWDHGADAIDPPLLKTLREQTAGRSDAWTERELLRVK